MVITQIGYLKYITECVKNDVCPSKTSKWELNRLQTGGGGGKSLWKYFTSRSHLKSQNIGYKERNAWFLEMYAQEANTGLRRWLWWLSIQQSRPTSKSLSNGRCLSAVHRKDGPEEIRGTLECQPTHVSGLQIPWDSASKNEAESN